MFARTLYWAVGAGIQTVPVSPVSAEFHTPPPVPAKKFFPSPFHPAGTDVSAYLIYYRYNSRMSMTVFDFFLLFDLGEVADGFFAAACSWRCVFVSAKSPHHSSIAHIILPSTREFRMITARRYAYKRGLCCRPVSHLFVRPSVYFCLSRWCILSTRLKMSSNFFLGPVAPSL